MSYMYGMYQIMLICGKLLLQAECWCVAGGMMLTEAGVWCSGAAVVTSEDRGEMAAASSHQ